MQQDPFSRTAAQWVLRSRERVESFWRVSGAHLRFYMLLLGDIYEIRPRPSKSVDSKLRF